MLSQVSVRDPPEESGTNPSTADPRPSFIPDPSGPNPPPEVCAFKPRLANTPPLVDLVLRQAMILLCQIGRKGKQSDLEANYIVCLDQCPTRALSKRTERITRPDALPMLSAPRCATRMDPTRESSSYSGHLIEIPRWPVLVPPQLEAACDLATHDQPRCVEVLLIGDARRYSNRQTAYHKDTKGLLARPPSPPTSLTSRSLAANTTHRRSGVC